MLASYNGNFETTKMLLEYKAEVDRKNDKDKYDLLVFVFKVILIL